MNENRLTCLMGAFGEISIAVVGDYFVDKTLFMDRSLDELSVETGLTAYQVTKKSIEPGAAGTIVNNLSALGIGQVFAAGVIGTDGEGYELISRLKEKKVDYTLLLQNPEWFTPTYIKPVFMRPGSLEETNRLDIRNRTCPLSAEMEQTLIDNLYTIANTLDALIVLDQLSEAETGVVTPRVMEALIDIARKHPKLLAYADSRFRPFSFEHFIVKCNHHEAIRSVYTDYYGEADLDLLERCTRKIMEKTQKNVIITWGANGMAVLDGDDFRLVPAVKVDGEIDICGAGDAATAGLVSLLCSGANIFEAAMVGNLTASVTIRQIGRTGVATQKDILKAWKYCFKGDII